MNQENFGTLYGIGVGPGDPEYLTIKATRLLKEVDLIFAAATEHGDSLAYEIAKDYIPENTPIHKLSFKMSSKEEIASQKWESNADAILKQLKDGKNAAFITLGDPMTYSTFGYILKVINRQKKDIPIVTIPGITSYQAAAATINRPLVEGEESLLVCSATLLHKEKATKLSAENIALLKVYRHPEKTLSFLEENSFNKDSVIIRNCSRSNESVEYGTSSLLDEKRDYWTLVLAQKEKNVRN